MAGNDTNRRQQVSPAVYRRRRLIVVIGAVVVLVVIIAIIVGVVRGSGKSSAASSETPSASGASSPSSSSAEPSSSTPATPTCDQSKVTVAASTDAQNHAADQNPVLTLTVTNGGSVACDVNVGTSQMDFEILSGADRIFSSKDCQSATADLAKSIPPGGSEKANFPWQRNRTTEGCQAIATKPGAGVYTLTVSLGKLTSPKAVFTLDPAKP